MKPQEALIGSKKLFGLLKAQVSNDVYITKTKEKQT